MSQIKISEFEAKIKEVEKRDKDSKISEVLIKNWKRSINILKSKQ